MFRVQKMLFAEYQEIYEPVILESPFTLVNVNGEGLRQYQIGLTDSKLLFGCDNFNLHKLNWCCTGQDPEIESFDLVSMVPLDYTHFNFYQRGDRYLMVLLVYAEDSDAEKERPMIFEFGGHIHKLYFWQAWRDQVPTFRSTQTRSSQTDGSHICTIQTSDSSPNPSSDEEENGGQPYVVVHVARRPHQNYRLFRNSAGAA